MSKPCDKTLRCAVYTRKSTEEGLGQVFNSLDVQREAGEAFIASQRQQGWILVEERYDDGGFSGATVDRPALQRWRIFKPAASSVSWSTRLIALADRC